jgi:hypothetical protein
MTKKKQKVRKGLYFSFCVTGMLFVFYATVGFFAGWNIVFSDLESKGRVAGTMVSAVVKVFDFPDPPVLSASAGCDAQNRSYVSLSWPVEDDATSYDVYRNEEELEVGLLDNFYTDENVNGQGQHSYYVVAVGPMGTASSESVSIAVEDCSDVFTPQISVMTFENRNVSSYGSIPKTKDRRSTFSGTTNIPFANITIQIHSGPIVYGSTQANGNGFWQWTPPVSLSRDTHTAHITATDPEDPSISATTNFVFQIEKKGDDDSEDDDSDDEEEKEEISTVLVPGGTSSVPSQEGEGKKEELVREKPFDFQFELEGESLTRGVFISEEAYRGESLEVEILFNEEARKFEEMEIVYVFSNETGLVSELREKINIGQDLSHRKKLALSHRWKVGKYKLQVSAIFGDVTVSHEGYFFLKDRPIIVTPGGMILTWADVLRNLSRVIIFSLFVLLVFFALICREHFLAKRAFFQITEKFLKRKGYIN